MTFTYFVGMEGVYPAFLEPCPMSDWGPPMDWFIYC
jgi:hypothetical protein